MPVEQQSTKPLVSELLDCTHLSVKILWPCIPNACIFMYKLYTSNTEVPIFSSHTQIHHLAHPVGCTYLTLETPVLSCQDLTMTPEKPPLAEVSCTLFGNHQRIRGRTETCSDTGVVKQIHYYFGILNLVLEELVQEKIGNNHFLRSRHIFFVFTI